MSTHQHKRLVLCAVVVSLSLLSSHAFSGSDERSGKRRGPPPQALEACSELAEGSACAFEGRRGEVEGTCFVPLRDTELLVCAPADRQRSRPEEEGETE